MILGDHSRRDVEARFPAEGMIMQTVILSGGLGTRIRSVFTDIPKALIPLAGRPFVDHQLSLLRRNGITDVIMCVGHLGNQIVDFVDDGSRWDLKVRYSFDDPGRLLGTAGAVLKALPLLRDEFMIMYGDSYLPTDYRAVMDAFRERHAHAMMCVYRNFGKWDPSNVRIANGKVIFYSKQASPGEVEYIDYGLTVFRRLIVESYRSHATPLDLQTILQEQVAQGCLASFEVKERFYEIGKPEGIAACEAYLLEHRNGV